MFPLVLGRQIKKSAVPSSISHQIQQQHQIPAIFEVFMAGECFNSRNFN